MAAYENLWEINSNLLKPPLSKIPELENVWWVGLLLILWWWEQLYNDNNNNKSFLTLTQVKYKYKASRHCQGKL